MIRKINSPQGLIALSLFLGTFCAFEAVSTEKGRQKTKTDSYSSEKKDTRNEDAFEAVSMDHKSQQTKIVPTPPKKDTRNEDIKKNILDSLKEEQEATSNATEKKRRVYENIYAEIKKNKGKIPAEELAEIQSFLQKKFAEIKVFEEYLGQHPDEMRQFERLSLSRVDPSKPEDPRAKTSMGAASAEDDLGSISDEAPEKWDLQAKTSMGAGSWRSRQPSEAAASAAADQWSPDDGL